MSGDSKEPTTATTPAQLRAIADAHWMPIRQEQEVAAALRNAADTIELLMQQRDALAEVAGIEPEWTENDV